MEDACCVVQGVGCWDFEQTVQEQRSCEGFRATYLYTSLVSLAIVGGVNHGQSCHPHCRLANFRDLMFRVNYTSAIGRNLALLCESSSVTQVVGNFQPITDEYFPPYIQITEFRQTTVRMTVVDPSHVLQKLYDLMYRVKYAAVIGLRARTI